MKVNRNTEEKRDIYRLHVSLRQLVDALYKLRMIELNKYRISPEQAAAIICISNIGEKATPAEISRWLFRERHSVLVLLRRMEKLGLIKMAPNIKNKHSIIVSLTEKGREAYQDVAQFHYAVDVIGTLPKKKREQLYSLLQVLRNRAFKNLKLNARANAQLTAAIMFPFSDIEE